MQEINIIKNFNKIVKELACTLIELASKEILNCTTCGVSECEKDKKRNYLKKYCEGSRYRDEETYNNKY